MVFVRDSVSYPIGLFSKLPVASEFAYPDSINLEPGVYFYSSLGSSLRVFLSLVPHFHSG